MCNRILTNFFLKGERDQFPINLLESSFFCQLQVWRRLAEGPELYSWYQAALQFPFRETIKSRDRWSLHLLPVTLTRHCIKRPHKPPPFWLHMKSPLSVRRNGTRLEADQTNESHTSSVKGKGSVGEALHVALWESHWEGSIKEQLDWTHRSTTEI